MKRFKIRKSALSVIFICVTMMLLACAPELRKPVSAMDTPEHHSAAGLRLLEEDKYKEAEREFSLAIQISPEFSQAHAGISLVKAYTGDHQGAAESMKMAWKYANTKEEKLFVYIGRIRLSYKGMIGKEWLNDARDEFDRALKIDPKSSAAFYYMGIAYISALDFNQAGQMFRQVIDLKKEYVKDADVAWNLVQKIQRAMPGTIAGKKIALLQRITRADAAALFMEELKIDNLYKKRSVKTFDTSFKDPETAKSNLAATLPKDIADHPLKVDIEGILGVGVRGLETYSDGLFRPGEFIDRATYAMMLEDILIKVTGDNSLATKFIGQVSPFPDLRSDLPYFNAVMVVTTRTIMGVKDFSSGEFAPLGEVPGVDALLIIRKIQEELKF
jgi:Tfp pilus assembly protein PilF